MEEKQNRNILDMIRDDETNPGSKKNWKTFRDKIRLKRAGKAWTSSLPIPASDIQLPKQNRMMIRRGSARYSSSNDDDNEDVVKGESHESDGEANRHLGDLHERQRSNRLLPVETDPDPDPDDSQGQDQEMGNVQSGDEPISLMALLSTDGSNYEQNEECEHEQHQDENVEHEDEIGDYNVCNECKGKHSKGAAVGPCGHMFCKPCTKELQIGKGNCPACNNFLLEILDIY